MTGGIAGQFLLWAEYEENIDRFNPRTLTTGIVLSKKGGTYIVFECLSRAGVDSFDGPAVKVERGFLDDILASGEIFYSQLTERIDNTLSAHGVVLDAEEKDISTEDGAAIDVLLIGNTGFMRKAVGLRRKGNGFMVCCKADGPMITDLRHLLTGRVLIVDEHQISLLYRHRFTRPGRMLTVKQNVLLQEILAQEA